jgi:hypothetical protein
MTETAEVRTIDANKALELLHQAVATRSPEFNYRAAVSPRNYVSGATCRYEYDGNADCLIGTALSLFEVPIAALKAIDAGMPDDHEHNEDCLPNCADATISSGWAIHMLEEHGHVVLTDAAVQVFRAGQLAQDTGSTWGVAEADAQQEAERLGTV